MDYKPRLSTFFFLIGLGSLALFILLAFGGQVQVLFLLLAVAFFIIGSSMRPKKAPVETARFSAVRKARAESARRRQEQFDKRHKR